MHIYTTILKSMDFWTRNSCVPSFAFAWRIIPTTNDTQFSLQGAKPLLRRTCTHAHTVITYTYTHLRLIFTVTQHHPQQVQCEQGLRLLFFLASRLHDRLTVLGTPDAGRRCDGHLTGERRATPTALELAVVVWENRSPLVAVTCWYRPESPGRWK